MNDEYRCKLPRCGFPAGQTSSRNLQKITENCETFNRLLTTDAKIAQTPKTLIWTLNKAKLYRYVPVVPEEKRHRGPVAAGLRDHESAACAGSASRT